ncbi:MAG: rhomboid family intramembrane serine protease [Dehalococcoidia bacterium]|nr:rhomboid family intramembrane serine protease [Dehalococcoidia bacterium]
MFPLSDPDLKRCRRPIVNVLIIVLAAGIFGYQVAIGEIGRLVLFYQYGLIPAEIARGIEFGRLILPQGTFDITTPFPTWFNLFSSMFLHADWLHFGVNMLFLWVFGDNIEDRLGHVKYLLFYLAAGVAAAFLQVAVNPDSEIPMIGASGAIAGVLGAYFLLHPFSRVRTLLIIIIIPFLVRIPAVLLLGFWFFIQFVSGVGTLVPSQELEGGVAYWAHIGGFVFGIVTIVVYKLVTREKIWPGRRDGGGTGMPPVQRDFP